MAGLIELVYDPDGWAFVIVVIIVVVVIVVVVVVVVACLRAEDRCKR